ncbi:uncharacterized protein LOC121738241 [Aricia agestis]|uniref:uncharacterized protein LOC121738241 n=1 Tax=Aricia agestis TaxID=91739 RepID=UPI001C208DEC|nr:uncharacterized protein LOC121738241 [Aricia agestis]
MLSILLLTLLTPNLSSSAKNQASPVYEVVNEQARSDDRIRISSNSGLPYGNPLAGNQNARLHFNNQQAMFNAERMRQLAAQLQRQSRGPKLIDSYMQAYHESQDNHQLALEQQQANIQKDKVKNREEYIRVNPQRETKDRDEYVREYTRKTENPQSTYGLKTRTESRKTQRTEPIRESARKTQRSEVRELSRRTRPEMMRITKADAKDVRYRNHRSYGSVDYYQQYLEPQRYKTVYLSPGPTYDQGVTIKPNGNLGVAQETKTKLLTEAIPSEIKYVYPKQYHQMQDYKSIQEIQANSLLKNQEIPDYSLSDTNEAPLDYYFYLKDPTQLLPQNYDQYRYAQLANTYHTTPLPATDYKPITEDVDDIEDPNAKNPQAFTPLPPSIPTVPTKDVSVKVVPSLSTIPVNYKPQEQTHIYTFDEGIKQEETPVAQAVHYYQPYYEDREEKKKYLHTNVDSTGVQHLTEDGSVSAYGNDDLHYAANYEFGYRVHDEEAGNYFGHAEAKKGDSTDGHYHVLLPDGRMQSVKYHAGPSGFHADISYDHIQ